MNDTEAADPKPWVDIYGSRHASMRLSGTSVHSPRRMLMTHPHDGHTAADTCFDCELERFDEEHGEYVDRWLTDRRLG